MESEPVEPRCPVTRGEVDLDRYARLDGQWRAWGLSAPARRALVDAEILTIEDLERVPEEELASLHGMGPKALQTIRARRG